MYNLVTYAYLLVTFAMLQMGKFIFIKMNRIFRTSVFVEGTR